MVYLGRSLLELMLLGAAIAFTGNAVERACGALARERADQSVTAWLERFALGAVTWMALLFLLAAAGVLRAGVIVPVLGLCALAGAWVLVRDRRAAAALRGSLTAEEITVGERMALVIAAGGVCATLAALWLHALRPDLATDADVYHLTVPRLYLEHGGFYRVPWNVYSNWPLGIELLYAVALAVDSQVLAKQLHFLFGLLTLAATYQLSRGSRLAGWLAAGLVLLNGVVLFEIRVAYVDLAQAFFLVLGFGALERAVAAVGRGRRRALWIAGLCCAGMTVVKLNGFFGAVPLGVLWLLDRWRRRDRGLPPLGGEALALCAPALVLGLPWLVKTWVLTGNPVYPFLHTTFGGPEWSAELGEQLARWQRSIGMGREPLDWLLLPVRVILFGDFGYDRFDGRLHPVWVVLLPLALWVARTDLRSRRALLASGLYFLLWAATSQQARFLIPILPLLAIAAARSFARLPERPGIRPVLGTTAAAALVALLVHSGWIYLRQTPRLATDLVRLGDRVLERVVHPVYRVLDEQLPPTARIVLLNTNRAFFVRRPTIADSFFEASQIRWLLRDASTPEAARATLRALGATHVLYSARPVGVDYPPALLALLEQPALARPMYVSPDRRYILFELR